MKRTNESLTHFMKIVSKKIKEAVRAFTLIELLISIGIVAVLSTLTLLILNPVEIFKQTRDASRLASLDSLKKAISIYQTQQKGPVPNLGLANILYISLPDPNATTSAGTDCSGISSSLPALPTSSPAWT